MLMPEQITIREATPQEDTVIAKHFYQMWQDIGVPEQAIESDWLNITLLFIEQVRRDFSYKAFVAEVDSVVVGSVSCQIYAGLYPNIISPQHRPYGYIWGVYVEPSHRQQGIAKQLTSQAIAYLKTIGCTRAILNASPSGKPVYERLGFLNGNAMYLDLVE